MLNTEPGGKYSVDVTADVVTLIIRSVVSTLYRQATLDNYLYFLRIYLSVVALGLQTNSFENAFTFVNI